MARENIFALKEKQKMETKILEQRLDGVEKTEKPMTYEAPVYTGLKLVEDKAFKGYTSIRYWM